MNVPARNPADIPGAEAAFFKRQRIMRAAELVLFILLFGGIPLLRARFTLTEWSF